MRNYILLVKCYIRSQVSLFLQWLLENFHLNGLNVDNENTYKKKRWQWKWWWLVNKIFAQYISFFNVFFGGKEMITNLKSWNLENDT